MLIFVLRFMWKVEEGAQKLYRAEMGLLSQDALQKISRVRPPTPPSSHDTGFLKGRQERGCYGGQMENMSRVLATPPPEGLPATSAKQSGQRARRFRRYHPMYGLFERRTLLISLRNIRHKVGSGRGQGCG